MENLIINPIGLIESPFETREGMPIQPAGAKEIEGRVVLDSVYAEGLDDLDGFSHVILIYCFHKSDGYNLKVKPFMGNNKRGLFSTRAPRRPNPIGLSIVELIKRDRNILTIKGVDILDQTPVLDIKPYVPKFDSHPNARYGWLQGNDHKADDIRSDDRFTKPE